MDPDKERRHSPIVGSVAPRIDPPQVSLRVPDHKFSSTPIYLDPFEKVESFETDPGSTLHIILDHSDRTPNTQNPLSARPFQPPVFDSFTRSQLYNSGILCGVVRFCVLDRILFFEFALF